MKTKLEEYGVESGRANVLRPNDSIKLKNSTITAFSSSHCKNDFLTILQVLLRSIFQFKLHKCAKILKIHKSFPMKDQILSFKIQADDKNILLFGSAGFNENALPKTDVDTLIWAYQGRSDIAKYSLKIIEKIHPKNVILTHFDNSFPPLTYSVKTKKFVSLMKRKHPEINVLIPDFKQEIELKK